MRRSRCVKLPYYEDYDYYGVLKKMHNLISFNQLMGSQSDPHDDLLTEYYECLIECNDDQHICKRICKEVLVD